MKHPKHFRSIGFGGNYRAPDTVPPDIADWGNDTTTHRPIGDDKRKGLFTPEQINEAFRVLWGISIELCKGHDEWNVLASRARHLNHPAQNKVELYEVARREMTRIERENDALQSAISQIYRYREDHEDSAEPYKTPDELEDGKKA